MRISIISKPTSIPMILGVHSSPWANPSWVNGIHLNLWIIFSLIKGWFSNLLSEFLLSQNTQPLFITHKEWEKCRIYDLLREILISNVIQMNYIMMPHFLYETYQFNSLPSGQMLNSCSGKLLNQISGNFAGPFNISLIERWGRQRNSLNTLHIIKSKKVNS